MSLTGAIATYVIVWWLVLFMVLPIGSRAVVEDTDVVRGQDAGSPQRPRVLLKMGITTLVSGVLFGIIYWMIDAGHLTLEQAIS